MHCYNVQHTCFFIVFFTMEPHTVTKHHNYMHRCNGLSPDGIHESQVYPTQVGPPEPQEPSSGGPRDKGQELERSGSVGVRGYSSSSDVSGQIIVSAASPRTKPWNGGTKGSAP